MIRISSSIPGIRQGGTGVKRRGGEVVIGDKLIAGAPELAALMLPPNLRQGLWPVRRFPLMSSLLDITEATFESFTFSPALIAMASSARLISSSLRRTALNSRASLRYQCLRPSSQVRWTGTSSATSEPHQPDEQGGVKGPTASSKTIKFTSES